MNKLTKIDKPRILVENEIAWTSKYVALHNAGAEIPDSLSGSYRKPEIKQKLIEETHGKCAYCESKVSHIYPGDVEHIVPKSLFPEKIFAWENLTYACYNCNNSKSTYYSTSTPLLNPYLHEPAEHIRAYGSLIFAVDGSIEGDTSITVLKLNRAQLVEKRTERLESLNHLISRWYSESDPDRKALFLKQILEEAEADKEYSFIMKQYISDRCGR